jgi:hypothetical protein
MILYAATWIYEDNQQVSLNNAGNFCRLMSFYHLNDFEQKGKTTLEEYINNEDILSRGERPKQFSMDEDDQK